MKFILLSLLALCAGQAMYYLITYFASGSVFAAYQAQEFFAWDTKIIYIFQPWRLINSLFMERWEWFAYYYSGHDRIIVMLALFLSIPIFRSRNAYMILSYLVLAGVPSVMGDLGGYARYILLVFPLFLYAPMLMRRWSTGWFAMVVVILVVIQLIFLARFANHYWIA